ncbi:hypothetical protein YC2023_012479 [Brassica napus]
MKLFGTILYPKNRYLTLQFFRDGKNVLCDDYFDNIKIMRKTLKNSVLISLKNCLRQSTQFSTFNEKKNYIGNPLIGGLPTERRCEGAHSTQQRRSRRVGLLFEICNLSKNKCQNRRIDYEALITVCDKSSARMSSHLGRG